MDLKEIKDIVDKGPRLQTGGIAIRVVDQILGNKAFPNRSKCREGFCLCLFPFLVSKKICLKYGEVKIILKILKIKRVLKNKKLVNNCQLS